MFMATVDYLPDRKYRVLGLVSGARIISILAKTEFKKALDKVVDEAQTLGADGIIGIRVYTSPNGSTSVIGTAIKFLD